MGVDTPPAAQAADQGIMVLVVPARPDSPRLDPQNECDDPLGQRPRLDQDSFYRPGRVAVSDRQLPERPATFA